MHDWQARYAGPWPGSMGFFSKRPRGICGEHRIHHRSFALYESLFKGTQLTHYHLKKKKKVRLTVNVLFPFPKSPFIFVFLILDLCRLLKSTVSFSEWINASKLMGSVPLFFLHLQYCSKKPNIKVLVIHKCNVLLCGKRKESSDKIN